MKKEMKVLMSAVQAAGCRVEDRGVKWMVFCPDGRTVVTVHKTPSDHRALKNLKGDLRRGGVNV